MANPINPVDHPICLEIPGRRGVSAWLEHTPFAMWLISALRPGVLVELGTHYGISYCAFCQAIEALGLPTRAFAVDTWEGDPHSGRYSEEVIDSLRHYHDRRYARFSTLLRMRFDEASDLFGEKEIDLLHIDGYHTYEAVSHDFEVWRPKVSDRGVILFHDTEERDGDFGVWRLWEQLRDEHRSFTFLHEHGLGVLAVGPEVPEEVRALLELGGADLEPVRTIFHQMGRRLRLEDNLETALVERDAARTERDATRAEWEACRAERDAARVEVETHRAERDAARAQWEACRAERDAARAEWEACRAERDAARAESDQALFALRGTEERLAAVQRDLNELLSSQTWRAFHQVHLLAGRIAPNGSLRRRAFKRIGRLIELVGREGVIGLARRQIRQSIDRTRTRRAHGVAGDRQKPHVPMSKDAAWQGRPHSDRTDTHTRAR